MARNVPTVSVRLKRHTRTALGRLVAYSEENTTAIPSWSLPVYGSLLALTMLGTLLGVIR